MLRLPARLAWRRHFPGSGQRIMPVPAAWTEKVGRLQKALSGGPGPCQTCPVRDLSVCGALSDDELGHLMKITGHLGRTAGQHVFFENDPADSLYVIVEGCVKLYKLLPDGRRQITGFLFPADFLGLALQDRYAYAAEAVTSLELCRFPRRQLEVLLDRFPTMEKRLLGIASNELVAAQDQMLLLGRKTAQEKLASFLAMLSRRWANAGRDPGRLALPMNRVDIADYTGLTVETVSRAFTRLRKARVIGLENSQTVVIADPEKLRDIAGFPEPGDPGVAAMVS